MLIILQLKFLARRVRFVKIAESCLQVDAARDQVFAHVLHILVGVLGVYLNMLGIIEHDRLVPESGKACAPRLVKLVHELERQQLVVARQERQGGHQARIVESGSDGATKVVITQVDGVIGIGTHDECRAEQDAKRQWQHDVEAHEAGNGREQEERTVGPGEGAVYNEAPVIAGEERVGAVRSPQLADDVLIEDDQARVAEHVHTRRVVREFGAHGVE